MKGEASGVKVEYHGKGCATKASCDDTTGQSALCKDEVGVIVECDFSCCSGDLCNGAAVPMISVLMLLSFALVPFLS